MATDNQEREVKLYVTDLAKCESAIQSLGAECTRERVHEVNLRFDTPDRRLSSVAQVLRLRKDRRNRVTYKGPGNVDEGVRSRQEIEFTVDDFDQARLFFEALGYEVMMIYEKYRTTYEFEGAEIVLDEMPYGNFLEIEANDAAQIESITKQLGLDWEARIFASYTTLFDVVRTTRDLGFTDLTFENFAGLQITALDLGVALADQAG